MNSYIRAGNEIKNTSEGVCFASAKIATNKNIQ